MRLPRLRTVVVTGIAAAVVALLAFLFAPSPIQVDEGVVSRGAMTVTLSSEGKTRVKELYEVVAPIAGRLHRVALRAGDPVFADRTVIFTIEPPQPQFHDSRSNAELEAKVRAAEASRDHAKADLERARADYEFAKREDTRNKELSKIGAVTDRILQQTERDTKMREAAVEVAENVIKQRDSELELARASLSRPTSSEAPGAPNLEVRSPIDGEVLNVLKESEMIVAPGAPIVQLGDTRKLEIMLEMLSEDAVRIAPGATATVEGWGGGALRAKVRRIEPAGFTKISSLGIEEQRVKVLLDFLDPPEAWRHLGAGFRVTAKIQVWTSPDVLKAPLGALFRSDNRWAAYVARDGVAHLTKIDIGHVNDAEAEVLDGLKGGDSVILHPSDRIADGVPVKSR